MYVKQEFVISQQTIKFSDKNPSHLQQIKPGIYCRNNISWYAHYGDIKMELPCTVVSKQSEVSSMLKSSKGISSTYMIRNVYFTKFQALLKFGMIFWWGIGGKLCRRIFRIQKSVIRSMVGVSSRTFCRQLFKE